MVLESGDAVLEQQKSRVDHIILWTNLTTFFVVYLMFERLKKKNSSVEVSEFRQLFIKSRNQQVLRRRCRWQRRRRRRYIYLLQCRALHRRHYAPDVQTGSVDDLCHERIYLFGVPCRGIHSSESFRDARLPCPQVISHPFEPVHGGWQWR